MSFVNDFRAVSESAVEQLAGRFSDLPRPLLAAIGAGDMAVERLAELREALMESMGTSLQDARPSYPADVRTLAADFPARAQKVAADVAGSLERLAASGPGKAQEMISELPVKVSEIAQSFSPDMARDTVEAYTQLAAMIYGSLADRGGKMWTRVRSAGLVPGTVVDAAKRTPPANPAPVGDAAPPTRTTSSPATDVRPSEATLPDTAGGGGRLRRERRDDRDHRGGHRGLARPRGYSSSQGEETGERRRSSKSAEAAPGRDSGTHRRHRDAGCGAEAGDQARTETAGGPGHLLTDADPRLSPAEPTYSEPVRIDLADPVILLVTWVLDIASLLLGAFAAIDAGMRRPDAYAAADKQSKGVWTGITIACAAVFLLGLLYGGPFESQQLLWMAAMVGALVYLLDVRPRLREVQRGSRW